MQRADKMKFGLGIPTASEGYYFTSPFADHEQISRLFKVAEGLGYDSAWVNERFNMPQDILEDRSKQPNFYEVISSLSYTAAITKRIRLATGVLQPSLRDPILLANQMATLDAFSKGRAILGVGVGANKQEFVAMKPRNAKAHRGDMLDEFLVALTLLLSQDNVTHKGSYYEFHNVTIALKPIQRPLPIYIAGRSPDTLRRMAHWCAGWLMPISSSPGDVRQRREELLPLLEKEGRSISELDLAAVTILSLDKDREKAVRRFRNSRLTEFMGSRTIEEFTQIAPIGTPQEAIERIVGLKEAGATTCIVSKSPVDDFEELVEQFQMFAEEVMPFVG